MSVLDISYSRALMFVAMCFQVGIARAHILVSICARRNTFASGTAGTASS